jgi:hypothetical protein
VSPRFADPRQQVNNCSANIITPACKCRRNVISPPEGNINNRRRVLEDQLISQHAFCHLVRRNNVIVLQERRGGPPSRTHRQQFQQMRGTGAAVNRSRFLHNSPFKRPLIERVLQQRRWCNRQFPRIGGLIKGWRAARTIYYVIRAFGSLFK